MRLGDAEFDAAVTVDGNLMLEKMLKHSVKTSYPIYEIGDVIKGQIALSMRTEECLQHNGIFLSVHRVVKTSKMELIQDDELVRKNLMISSPIENVFITSYGLRDVPYTSATYHGNRFTIDYVVRLTIGHLTVDAPFVVVEFDEEVNRSPLHNEVGIKNVVHIEMVYPCSTVDVNGCLVCTAYFTLAKLRVASITIEICAKERLKKEKPIVHVLRSFDVLDGFVVRGDPFPIRVYLGSADIWPVKLSDKEKVSVESFLRIKMRDEHGKSYSQKLRVKVVRERPY